MSRGLPDWAGDDRRPSLRDLQEQLRAYRGRNPFRRAWNWILRLFRRRAPGPVGRFGRDDSAENTPITRDDVACYLLVAGYLILLARAVGKLF